MPRAARAQRFLADPDAFLHDPAVQAMSLTARGAYGPLWLNGWHQKEPGVYLADDRSLAILAMCSGDEWASVRDEVSRAFDTITRAGWWVLRGFAVTLRAQTRKRTMERNRQRRMRVRERDVTLPSRRDLPDGSGSGSGSGTGVEEKKPPTPARAARLAVVAFDPLAMPLPEWLPAPAWADWCAHRRDKRQRLTERAARLCLAKLTEFRETGDEPKAVLEQSIAGGWTGLFPLKGTAHANGNGHAPPARASPATIRQLCLGCYGDRQVPAPAPTTVARCPKCPEPEDT